MTLPMRTRQLAPLITDQDRTYAERMELAFPKIDPEFIPCGVNVLVQIRSPRVLSRGGILIVQEGQETEKWNTQVGKVIALGPVCFKNRTTLEEWPEKAWFKVGDYVRVPKYGGDRFERPVPGREPELAIFVVCKDLEVTGIHTGDPLEVIAFL